MSHRLHQGAPPPLNKAFHVQGASLHSQCEVAWLGDTERVPRVWAHLADCQRTGGFEKGQTGWGGGGGCGALGYGQALNKRCFNMHRARVGLGILAEQQPVNLWSARWR